MKKTLLVFALLLAANAFATDARRVEATYTGTVSNIPAGLEKLNVWIPLPVSRGPQVVSDVRIDSPFAFTVKHEKELGTITPSRSSIIRRRASSPSASASMSRGARRRSTRSPRRRRRSARSSGRCAPTSS